LTQTAKINEKVSIVSMIAYGIGGGAEGIMANMIYALALPIYNVGFGIDARIIGMAIAIPRLWDAVTDPFMGNISDNIHTRWGRRRPFIFFGAILTGLFCSLMWSPPSSLNSNFSISAYFVIMSMIYFLGYTIFSVPYNAIGYELSSDYDERTKLMSYKTMIANGLSIMLMPFAYKLCFYFGDNEIEGVKTVGLLYGLLIIVLGVFPVFFCREKFAQKPQAGISLLKAAKLSIKNIPFLLVTGMVLLTITSYFVAFPLQLYINLSHVVPGDKERAATFISMISFVSGIVGIISVPLINYYARRFEKMQVMIFTLLVMLVGSISSWWLFTPSWPYLQLLYPVLVAPALSGMWVVSASCIADICDIDELHTSRRREGMYGAIFALIRKCCVAGVIAGSGYIISLSGFDRDAAVQTEFTGNVLRGFHAFGPALLIALSILCCVKYPITRERIAEVHLELGRRDVSQEDIHKEQEK
jgi:GPH family glycoside/pentoside/hexuronide:cation symporter